MAEIKNLLRPLVRYLKGIVRRNILVPGRRIWGRQIPIAMITGSKGKTTTSRMLADILDMAGYTVGLASTDGVIIDGKYLNRNDDASYYGARAVLTNRSVTAAVLETARGGLIKWGLYVDRCNVAALLNVGKEQIGIDGIETVEEMTSLKQQVINAAKDAVILNADNIHCSRLIDQYAPNKLTLFSIDPENRQIHNHLLNGGKAYVIEPAEEGSTIIRRHKNSKSPIISIKDLQSCEGGVFHQNIYNAMAAAALAEGMGISIETIHNALKSFQNSMDQSPGRFTFITGYSQTILFDASTCIPSSAALAKSIEQMNYSGPKLCMFTAPGNRPDWMYTQISENLAPHFDKFICFDLNEFRRGRSSAEISELLETGLIRAGISSEHIKSVKGFEAAVQELNFLVGKDDLVVVLTPYAVRYLPVFKTHFSRHVIET